MSIPAVIVSDPEREVVTVLAAALGPGVAFTAYPSSKIAPGALWVQVELEGGNVADYPITERAQVRITCHAAQRTAVKAHADTVRRHLATFPGSSTVAGIHPVTGRSGVSTDPDTGNLMCWLLVRVDLKASLAS